MMPYSESKSSLSIGKKKLNKICCEKEEVPGSNVPFAPCIIWHLLSTSSQHKKFKSSTLVNPTWNIPEYTNLISFAII